MSGPYVPIEDLANHFSVSVSTIRGWIKRDQIPKHTFIRVGNTYRFSIDDVSVALSAPKPVNKASDEPDESFDGIPDDDDGNGNADDGGIMPLDTNDAPLVIPHDFDEDQDL